ncbi:hypothetical protein NIES4072_33620 [Nostoc commune NIES-4072]|uniref:Uncharacterized protein n=2 Tax=Nostoc commune TaxID=1178 RepID=A0A2R5FU05_NOSCO|nr:hypothetical protein NIES4070_57200 [Nostoc commune HK-02]GBG19693.1 hypothetical protein NIES4072_33620 [Nostoc commune NIES-4072]
MRLENQLSKLIAFLLSTILIIRLNFILLRSSVDLHFYLKNSNVALYPDYSLFQLARHILKVFGATIVEVAFVWLLVILNTISLRVGLIITLVLLILTGMIILVPISI